MDTLTTLTVAPTTGAWLAPATDVDAAVARYQHMLDFVRKVLRKGVDYSKLPGTDKDVLLKPGAEKLASFFGLTAELVLLDKVEDWDRNLFQYRYQARLTRDGLLIAASEGSASSFESKYRYRWVKDSDLPAGIDKTTLKTRGGSLSEFDFAVEKAETTGQYGKPPEYWAQFRAAIEAGTARRVKRKTKKGGEMDAWEIDGTLYRTTNEDMPDIINTVQKIAQKRALVGTVIIATNASEYFTQDLDDLDYESLPRAETFEESRARFLLELADFYPNLDAIRAAFVELGLPAYSPENHTDLRKQLITAAVLKAHTVTEPA